MRLATVLSCFMTIVSARYSLVDNSGELSLEIYYESLCPDSTRFISKQVGPMHDAIGQDVKITFAPYGFASVREAFRKKNLNIW